MDFDKSINTPAPAQPEIPIVESKKELVENLSSQHHDPNPWPESLNNQIHFENPWAVEDGLEHFLYYCCPECDMKHPSREIFLQHAINHHPLSKECLHMLTGVKDENFLDDDYMDDDHIMDSADPIKVYPNLFTQYFFDGRYICQDIIVNRDFLKRITLLIHYALLRN